MPRVHATWIPDGGLFLWSDVGPVDEAAVQDLQGLSGHPAERVLILPGTQPRRRPVPGREVPVGEAVAALAALPRSPRLTDSVWCWSRAALLALELAAYQRVIPSVVGAEARWRALLNRQRDRERFNLLAAALPAVARAAPTRARGPIRIHTREAALQSFLDAAVDALYRQNAHAGSARGWVFQFVHALRGPDATFVLRDARYQGIPEMITAWSAEREDSGLQVGFELNLPDEDREDAFRLDLWVHSQDDANHRVPLAEAWKAGARLAIDGRTFVHPAHSIIRGLARAARMLPPLGRILEGRSPTGPVWNNEEAWRFLAEGSGPLRDAGFIVRVPEEFASAGRRRIRARMRIDAVQRRDGAIDLASLLSFRWEVVLGDSVISGAEFAELAARKQPLVQYRGEWVLLDPAEVERLPDDLNRDGRIPAAEALLAVLTGEYKGIPVIADDRLALILTAIRTPPAVPIPRGLRGTLRPYQRDGFSWLTALGQIGLGACLADDMGLGKTIQVITHLLRRVEAGARSSLVVCPTSILGNWVRELTRFAPSLRLLRYHGLRREDEEIPKADVVITTYGVMVRDQEELAKVPWDCLILDEAQSIKNPDSRRAHAARSLKARHRIAMSGTPVENRLDELWSIMEFLVPGLLGPRARFQREIAVPVERFGDEDVARRLKLAVSPFLLRRVKSDPTVIADLPEKFEHRMYCPLTAEQARLYREVVEEKMAEIEGANEIERRGRVLSMLTSLKQVCNHPAHYLDEKGPLEARSGKLERVVDLLDNILAANERALIFTQYVAMGTLIQSYLSDLLEETVPFLHGGTPPQKREEMVYAFQEDDDAPPILIVSLRAGGTGLNLTRATHVIHYDRWWNPAVEDQATDRAYRIGQRRDVEVHKIVVQDTLEERIDRMLEDKRALAEQVVGQGERWVTELDDSELRRLVALGEDAVMEDE